jgi:hypothetical protein
MTAEPSNLTETRGRHRVQRAMRRQLAVLTLAAALLPLAGCPLRNHEFSGAEEALAGAQSPLAWTVNAARATHRLDTSTLESKEAAPGNQFIVLDVSVRNRDVAPQVLPQGRLIAMNEAQLQTFDTPVTLLSDDYLSLQVLSPAQSMRGKIAYEVPEPLSGVLYWSPGNGSKRILLNVATAPKPQRTLASADDDSSPETNVRLTPIAPTEAGRKITPDQSARREIRTVVRAASPTATSSPAKVTSVVAASVPENQSTALAPVVSPVQMPHREVATISVSPPTLIVTPATATPAVAVQSHVDSEQVRKRACQGLVSRDDPSEKERNLGFFAESCRDYALPAHWQPPARKSLLARASALIARVVAAPRVVLVRGPACDGSATHADELVCRDARLSAMDHQLAQTVTQALDHVNDPVALQRDQAVWRGRVRDRCDTTDCLESAYGRRIAQLDALSSARP